MQMSVIQSLKLVAVEVTGGNQVISWPHQENIAIQKGLLDAASINRLNIGSAVDFPALHPHFRDALQAHFDRELRKSAAPLMTGNQSVKLVVNVRNFTIPSVVRRMVLGGASFLRADIEVVDISSNRTLLKYEGRDESFVMASGSLAVVGALMTDPNVDETAIRLISWYSNAFAKWLRGRQS